MFPLVCLLAGLLAPGATQDAPLPAEPSALSRARQLAPGRARARALMVALESVAADALPACLELSFEEFLNQTRAFQFELALPLAEAMHRRARAPWSASSLALAATRSGSPAEAQAVLREQLDLDLDREDRTNLLERIGLASLAAGEQDRARRELGAAFTRGSANAGVVLGRMDLQEGHLRRSRAIFRSLLDRDQGQSWARRGWGLSMLPRGPLSAPASLPR
jgi:hypothetical protein